MFSKALGPFFPCLSARDIHPNTRRVIQPATHIYHLCRYSFSSVALSLHSGQYGSIARSPPLSRRKPIHESFGRNNFRNFLRKHSSEIFTENKKSKKGTTFSIKSVFLPRLLHICHKSLEIVVNVFYFFSFFRKGPF